MSRGAFNGLRARISFVDVATAFFFVLPVFASERILPLPEAMNIHYPATFVRGVARSERPAFISKGLTDSLRLAAKEFVGERLPDKEDGNTARVYSLPIDAEWPVLTSLNCLRTELVDIQFGKWNNVKKWEASCRADKLECVAEGKMSINVQPQNEELSTQYHTELQTGDCVFIPQNWQVKGEVTGVTTAWHWLPLRDREMPVTCTNRLKKVCNEENLSDCAFSLEDGSASPDERLKFHIIASLKDNIEGNQKFLEEVLKLSLDEIEEVGKATDIGDIAARHGQVEAVDEERVAGKTVKWLRENIDDDKLNTYYEQAWRGACTYSLADHKVIINDLGEEIMAGRSHKSFLVALSDFSEPLKLVRSVQGFLSPEEFFAEHTSPGRPVIMKGAARMLVAYRYWTKTYLKKKYGQVMASAREKSEMSLDEFFTEIPDGGVPGGLRSLDGSLSPDWWGDVGLPPSLCCGGFEKRLLNPHILVQMPMKVQPVTSEYTVPLSYQPYEMLSCVLRGYLNFTVISKDEASKITIDVMKDHMSKAVPHAFNPQEYPLMRSIQKWENLEVEPGDCIYIPSWWYRHVIFPHKVTVIDFLWNHLVSFDDTTCADRSKVIEARKMCPLEEGMLHLGEEYRYHIIDEMASDDISPKDLTWIFNREDHTYGTEKDAKLLFKAADVNENGRVSADELLRLDSEVYEQVLGSDDPARMERRGLEIIVPNVTSNPVTKEAGSEEAGDTKEPPRPSDEL